MQEPVCRMILARVNTANYVESTGSCTGSDFMVQK